MGSFRAFFFGRSLFIVLEGILAKHHFYRIFDDVVEWEGMVGCRADLAGLERRSFLDGSTNSN